MKIEGGNASDVDPAEFHEPGAAELLRIPAFEPFLPPDRIFVRYRGKSPLWAFVWGSGTQNKPLQLAVIFDPIQGDSARFPTPEEVQAACDQLVKGAVMQPPPFVAGHPFGPQPPSGRQDRGIMLAQMGAVPQSPAAVRINLTGSLDSQANGN